MFRPGGPLAFCVGLALGMHCLSAGGADPQQSESQSEALRLAAHSGNLSDVERLIAAGADVNARDVLGTTALHDAAWSGHLDVAAFLIAHGADINAQTGQRAATPLEFAVLQDHASLVKLLAASGARLDTRFRNEQTILHLACAQGDPQIVAILLGAHADLNATDASGDTALDTAVLHGRANAVLLLIAHGADARRVHPNDGRGPLHEACMKGSADLMQPLVDAGADPATPDRFGETPLDLALAFKNSKAVAALLHLTVGAKEMDQCSQAAMEAAVVRGRTELVRILIEAGFDVNRPTASGSTYLHDAALKGQRKTAQLLLDRGAKIDALDRHGATPLHNAALGGYAEVIGLLLDRGAAVDARDQEEGATALMLAAGLGRVSAVALLLRRGANPMLKDRAGRTALDLARETEDDQTVKLLESALAGTPAAPGGPSGGPNGNAGT